MKVLDVGVIRALEDGVWQWLGYVLQHQFPPIRLNPLQLREGEADFPVILCDEKASGADAQSDRGRVVRSHHDEVPQTILF